MIESINHSGLISDDYQHTGDEIYITPSQLEERFGISASVQQINLAMVMIHDYCNRKSLWPVEYTQRVTLAADRSTAILSVRPVLSIIEAKGRYIRGRRDRQYKDYAVVYNNIIALMGTAPGWNNIDPATVDFYGPTSEIWIPSGLFLAPYGEVLITYLAGYIEIPEKALAAIALIINAICVKGESDMVQYSSGRVSRRFATPSYFTADVKRMLSPFVVRSLY